MPSRKKRDVSSKRSTKNSAKKAGNPFEVKVNRKKYDVLGQRSKSESGLPGVSRSKAIQKRKKTLLVEYKQKNKTNHLVDRRFGEGQEDLSVEEKMMKRFILERKRKHERSSAFNLNEEEELTHYGQSIGEMEMFDHVTLTDEEDMEEEDIAATHFGGFTKKKRPLHEEEEQEDPPKTRKQVLDEIVAKSKAGKYERQSEKMEVENLMEQVDSEWKAAHGLLPKAEVGGSSKSVDDYDRSVRELQFERRGQPLDRMRTEEELAREEKERLEKLEVDRIKRMKGLFPESGGWSHDSKSLSADFMADPGAPTKKKDTRFTLRYKDGRLVVPDEGEVFPSEGEHGDGGGSEGVDGEEGDEEGRSGEDSEEGESEEDVEGGSEGDSGEEDEEESGSGDGGGEGYGSDLDSEASGEEEPVVEEKDGDAVKAMELVKKSALDQLPYTFTVPRSLQEFCSIVEQRTPDECLTAVERIHACNHPSFSPTNKDKLQEFLAILVNYCMGLGRAGLTHDSLATLNKLVSPLFKLTRLDAHHASTIFCKVLSDEYSKWSKRKKEILPFPTLIVFQLCGLVFSASDYQHPVTTPAFLFMGQILAQSQAKSVSDLLRCLVMCSSMMEYISDSKRFVPELVNFLSSVIGCFSKSSKCVFLPPFTAKSKLRRELCMAEGTAATEGLTEATLLEMVVAHSESSSLSRCDLLKVTLDLSSRLLQLYKDVVSFPELFLPLTANLARIPSSLSAPLTEVIQSIQSSFAKLAAQPRDVLQMLKQKPKSIKFYEPKFDEIYAVDRKKPHVKSAREHQKLKHKLKKETKGAVREIRRDAAFLANVKLEETLLLDAERQKKTRKLMHELQNQQHEAKVERLRAKKRH